MPTLPTQLRCSYKVVGQVVHSLLDEKVQEHFNPDLYNPKLSNLKSLQF